MDSAGALIQQRLATSVRESIALLMYDNAKFLCERLVAVASTESNVCLLALCYYHCNQAYRSYHLLKGLMSAESRYLFALSCLQLGKAVEARDALCKGGLQIPNGAAGHYLLGRVSRLVGRITDAKEHFAQALRMDPLLWSAYEELCALGADDLAAEVCLEAQAVAAAAAPSSSAGAPEGPRLHSVPASTPQFSTLTPAATSFFTSGPAAGPVPGFGFGNVSMATCTPGPGPGSGLAPPHAPPSVDPMLALGGPVPAAPAAERAKAAVAALFGDSMTPGFDSGPYRRLNELVPPRGSPWYGGPNGLANAEEEWLQTGTVYQGGHDRLKRSERQDPGNSSFETPQAAAAPLQAPAPPQKDEGAFGKQQQQQGPAASSSQEPAATRQRGAAGGVGSSSRLLEDGKVRKVSGRLFQEPSRRSTRLAAKDSGASASASASGGGVGGGRDGGATAAAAASVASVLQPSFHQCQNLPDPDHPPAAASARYLQAYVDAKLRGGTPAAAGAAGPGFGTAEAAAAAATALAAQGQARSALALVLALLLPLLEGCRHLAMYRSREALQALSRLPRPQYNTAWVMCQVGRAHFELMDYPAAASAFESARSLDRFRLEGMETYSTALWHMRRDCELSFLAQEVIAVDRLAPQAWCVLGNFCSLQKEHDSAIQLFQRAIQLSPSFAYAYTLAGHEYFSNEDYDKSLTCFRTAVRLDPRHYNAMYGLGQIFLRQEKYDVALVHFKSASHINPRSSLLHCYIAMTLHRQGLHERALSKLNEAISIDPKNPLARFEKASVLMAMDCNSAALAELQQLSQLSPGEPSVYFQMGRLYKKLGDLERAQQQLEKALSFKSSAADTSLIQTAIEKLGLEEDEDEDEL